MDYMEKYTLDVILDNLSEYVDILAESELPMMLMDKPDGFDSSRYRKTEGHGRLFHDVKRAYHDPTYWTYPKEGIEERVVDDEMYRVWYSSKDAADPSDFTIWNKIVYIEHISAERKYLRKKLEDILKKL